MTFSNMRARLRLAPPRMALVSAVAFMLGAAAQTATAATVTLADGVLPGTTSAQYAEGVFAPLTTAFNIANGPLTFSGRLDPTSAGNGDYNLGMTVGAVYFLIHPGYAPVPGAFRADDFDVNNANLVAPNSNGGNESIGYVPSADPLDFLIVLTDAGGGNVNVAIDITQGGNTSSIADRLLAASKFGTGGQVSSFGVMHNGIPVSGSTDGRGPLAYSGVTAQVAPVPLPAALPLLLAALGAIGCLGRRRGAA